MRSIFALRVFAVTATIVIPGRSLAWNDSGHMAIARLAWHRLSDRERAFYSKLLQHHPHYSSYLLEGKPSNVSEVEWAFCRAAIWSDWLREPRGPMISAEQSRNIRDEYHKSVWHYVNLPIIHSEAPARLDAEEIQRRILLPPVDGRGEPRHVVAALHYNMKRLRAPDLAEEERAIALCWILHLVGDVHQPLHTVALISPKLNFEPPSGDQGGNRIAVQVWAGDRRAQKLHFYWDSIPLSGRMDFHAVDQVVLSWLADARGKPRDAELKRNDFLAWAEEGRDLARTVVYQHQGRWLEFKPLPAGPFDVEGLDAPRLPDGYRQLAEKTATTRQILAGFRLAGQLQEAMSAIR